MVLLLFSRKITKDLNNRYVHIYGMDMKKGYGNPLESMVKNDSYNQEIAQKLDSSLQGVTGKIYKDGRDINSIGSTNSGTNCGKPEDVDYDIQGYENSNISDLAKKLSDYKDKVVHTVREYMPLKNPKFEIEETKDEGRYKQIRAKIKDGLEDVLGIDLNFNSDVPHYRKTFHRQLNDMVENMDDKKAGTNYIKSQIREMKKYLKDNNVYKAKEGGLRGVGVEQLMVNLADKSYDNMEELMQDVNVGNALKKINDERYNLNIEHPNTGENLASNLYNEGEDHQKGWDKVLKAAENYKQFEPGDGLWSRIKDGVKKYSNLEIPKPYVGGYAPAY